MVVLLVYTGKVRGSCVHDAVYSERLKVPCSRNIPGNMSRFLPVMIQNDSTILLGFVRKLLHKISIL